LNAKNNSGDTALDLARLNKKQQVIGYLMKKEAKLDKSVGNNQSHESPSRFGLLSLLIEKNSNINTVNNKGDTFLHVACRKGLFDFAKCLLENGADLDAEDTNGKTPLDLANYSGKEDLVNLITSKRP
jgi:ankyrin repeat protein